ncbi:MAG: hypothetical protein IPL43_00180 [Micropruina sp.]|nr:hypothetical protein [Micropruina sp.]
MLASPYRVTGYALQVVAGDLSVLSGAALRAVGQAHQVGLIGPHVAAQTSASLTGSARAWAHGAAWPAHISLGGRTPGLRQASNDLISACNDTPVPTSTHELADLMAGMRAAVRAALPVAEQHTLTMHQLAWGHGLWIAASTIPHMYDTAEVNLAKARDGWTREPIWMQEGVPLLRASQQATGALLTASAFLDQTTQPALNPHVLARQLTLTHDRIQLTPTPDHRWETVTPPTSPPRAWTAADETRRAPGVGH